MSDAYESPEDIPWLQEMVDDDLLGLFSSEPEEVARCARQIVQRATEDPGVLERLIDALRTSVEKRNDDTQASSWIAIILGQIGDPGAQPVLFLALGGEDEPLQEAARDAILLMGSPAIDGLMDELEEEDPGPEMVDAAYRLLGCVGSLEDRALLDRTRDFLLDRVEREAARPREECRIESLFHAAALLGDRRMLAPMDRILKQKFGGKNAAIRDSREMLQENTAGEPFVYDKRWVEEHRWLFEADRDSLRVDRAGDQDPEAAEEEAEDPVDPRLAQLYWGLGATGKKGLDAREFIERPEGEEEEAAERPQDEDLNGEASGEDEK
jgi:hypothetical protein